VSTTVTISPVILVRPYVPYHPILVPTSIGNSPLRSSVLATPGITSVSVAADNRAAQSPVSPGRASRPEALRPPSAEALLRSDRARVVPACARRATQPHHRSGTASPRPCSAHRGAAPRAGGRCHSSRTVREPSSCRGRTPRSGSRRGVSIEPHGFATGAVSKFLLGRLRLVTVHGCLLCFPTLTGHVATPLRP
jgi:hypothetical protein